MLEIEVKTTKKRLTKSLLKQMRWPTLVEMQISEVLGYVYNVEDMGRVYLLKVSDGEYRKLPHGWKPSGEFEVSLTSRKHVKSIRFNTSLERNKFLDCLNRIEFQAKQVYV